MKNQYKKNILITGATGLLGSYFYKKFKNRYKILKYPNRIENINKFKKWIEKKKIEYFIHFAAATTNVKSKNFNKVNYVSTVNILNSLNTHINLKYFLFISTSHVYGFSNKKIIEKTKTKPINRYGLSKKKTEDFIIKYRNTYNYKIGIARIFNITGPKQRSGYFIPDIFKKIKNNNIIDNINTFRDFIHIDDVMDSLKLIINKKLEKPINISSGEKINLTKICQIINSLYFKKNITFGKKRGKDLYGDNKFLKSLGKKKFKNIQNIIKSYKK